MPRSSLGKVEFLNLQMREGEKARQRQIAEQQGRWVSYLYDSYAHVADMLRLAAVEGVKVEVWVSGGETMVRVGREVEKI